MRRTLDTGIELDDDPARIDPDALWAFLSTHAYWAKHDTRDDVVARLRSAARVIGVYDGEAMIGYARAASEHPGTAHLADVYVLDAHRGRGLGVQLVREMVDSGPLAAAEWSLNTADAQPLYERFGFLRTGERSMVRLAPRERYLAANRANWDDRAPIHAGSREYAVEAFAADRRRLAPTVAFDGPRLGSIEGLDAVHLQCHIGTDTISLARLGARMTGVDFSPASLSVARELAARSGSPVEFVESDVYDAPAVLEPASFDLVYTGMGALCWLPDIARWGAVVAALLRPGGRLFMRELHPLLWAIDEEHAEALRLGYPYFEQPQPLTFHEGGTYVETDAVIGSQTTHEWNHGLGEIISALLDAGLELTGLVEHDSAPYEALPGQMVRDERGEWRLRDRPQRLAASYTLQARRREG